MKNIEILAPACSYEGMRAAMNAGCDAVYIGGSSFGARAYADNPQEIDLLRAIDEAHIRGKKLYLTVNTLLKEKELTGKLYQFLEKYYLQGLDAVIVQDVGVLRFIHRYFPELPIHASTQMTLTMGAGANLLKDSGVTRLVTARELSFAEISAIHKDTDLEIETFVHGALCYCYSGQCLMSSMIGGRSGNRGRCAQPCRMSYQFYLEGKKASIEQQKYLLSPKDINTIENIPDLIEAGVDSFKIEGRMKRPEYAAAVAGMYRKYVDLYYDNGREGYLAFLQSKEYEKDMRDLLDVYNRGGFSKGYGGSYNGKHMMSLYRPNHSGVFVGNVEAVKDNKVFIRLKEEVHAQDILEIRRKEEEGYEFTVKDAHAAGTLLETTIGIRRDTPKGKRELPAITAKMAVYRTKNNELLEKLKTDYIEQDKKLGVQGILTAKLGEQLSLTVTLNEYSVTELHEVVQEAIKQPMSFDKLTAPIYKTGDTLYYFEDLRIDADTNIFIPVSWLNEIRRAALESLKEAVITSYQRSDRNQSDGNQDMNGYSKKLIGELQNTKDRIPVEEKDYNNPDFGITVSVQTPEQYETALSYSDITSINVEIDRFDEGILLGMAAKAAKAGKSFYLVLPHICRLSIYTGLEKKLSEIIDNKWITGFLIKNLEEYSLLSSLSINRTFSIKEFILNYNLYIFNQEAKGFWREKGVTHFTAPLELNWQELKQLGVTDCDVLVYGYLPMMVSAQCLVSSTSGCVKCREHHSGLLTDRMNKKFFVQTNCSSCYNIIYNGSPLSLHKQASDIIAMNPRNIRLDFTIETKDEMKKVINNFIEIYRYRKDLFDDTMEYTTGHFKRGVE